MKVLITSACSPLPRKLAAALSIGHQVRQTDRKDLPGVLPGMHFLRSDLGHDPATNELVQDVDAIVHSGEADAGATVSDQLDAAMRCTYNLLWAAAEEGVSRFVFLSSLSLLDKYDEGLAVTERWRPIPTTDVPTLCHHLGEYVCREFAREQKIDVTCLRLGELVGEDGGAKPESTSALYPDDAVRAVEGALTAAISGWNIFHAQSAVPESRFLTNEARKALDYNPVPRT